MAKINPVLSVPVVELSGRNLCQSYAVMRLWARQLSQYDGATDYEKYWVDAMCDIGTDCEFSTS